MLMETNYSTAAPSKFSFEDERLHCFVLDVNLNSTRYLSIAHVITLVVNLCLSFVAIGGNLLVISAVWKSPSLHTPSNLLLCCLAFSDFTVGFLAQPCFVVHKLGELYHHYGMYCATRILLESSGAVTTGTTVFTLTGIAFERYLALSLHLRYNDIVTTRRIVFTVLSIWFFFITLAVARLWIANETIYNAIVISLMASSLVFTLATYGKILKCVRRHEKQLKALGTENAARQAEHARSSMKILRFRKSTRTMLLIVGVFVACYLPYLCVKIAYRLSGYTTPVKTALLYASTLAFLNSSLNPFVYCWRMESLRGAVYTTLKKRIWKRSFRATHPEVESPKRKPLPENISLPEMNSP